MNYFLQGYQTLYWHNLLHAFFSSEIIALVTTGASINLFYTKYCND